MATDQVLGPALSERRLLGRSNVAVGPLVFGGAPIGGLFAPVAEDVARETLEAAWAAGIRAFDTAPHYGVGLSESRIGRFVARRAGDGAVVTTKVGRLLVATDEDTEGVDGFYGTPRRRRVTDFSAKGVVRSVEESLQRMGIPRVDVVFIHDPDDHWEAAVGEAYPALAELRAAGTIGAIGVGMNQTELLCRFVEETDIDCVLVAGRYSLLDRGAAVDLLPLCARRQVGVLVGGVFNSGLLADPRPGATYDYRPADGAMLARAQRLQSMCAGYGVTLAAAALRFALRHPAITGVVVGARSAAEITANAEALRSDIPDALWTELSDPQTMVKTDDASGG